MNRTLTPLVFAFGTSSLLLVDSAVKGSVILLGAGCLAVMLKRDSAAMRHLVWLVAIVAMLVIPVLSVLFTAMAGAAQLGRQFRKVHPPSKCRLGPWSCQSHSRKRRATSPENVRSK